MNRTLGICLVQPELRWEDPVGNLALMDRLLEGLEPGTDLVVLPETFTTGFTMNAAAFAEEEGGAGLRWMKKTASDLQVHLTGSMIFREQGKIYNRLFWFRPSGDLGGTYDKRHLFRMGREDRHFHPGSVREIFRIGEFRLLPQICYDLRFPVFARNRNDYDIALYVANWPAPRHPVWETLLRARAIENQAYVIGVSRSGTDGEGVDHLGGSCLVEPTGKLQDILGPEPGLLHVTADLKKIREFREKFPVWRDADQFSLE